jgi:hypothetical protein
MVKIKNMTEKNNKQTDKNEISKFKHNSYWINFPGFIIMFILFIYVVFSR